MKAAFDWKAQKNRARGIEGGADKILHFREAFHGRSGYTLSVTNTEPLKVADFPKFDWPRVSNPKITFPLDEQAVIAAEHQSIEEIANAFDTDPHSIAAILVEPIQCEGGDNHFRPEFLQTLRRIADERDALLIFDEVQTGMGVTGTMWAFQQMGMTPDLVAFGKKTQVCGVMAGPRIDEVETNVFHVSSRINSTWGGNLVDMVRCAQYLRIMHDEGLIENAATVGRVFLERLEGLQLEAPLMSNTRGRGLLLAFDLPDTATGNRVGQACWDAGFATLPCGPRSIRFRPALTFTTADVERGIDILRGVLAAQ